MLRLRQIDVNQALEVVYLSISSYRCRNILFIVCFKNCRGKKSVVARGREFYGKEEARNVLTAVTAAGSSILVSRIVCASAPTAVYLSISFRPKTILK